MPTRFRTLGEKRNACAAPASPDAEGFLVADDDVYLPHWFSTQAEALKQADWSRPSPALLAQAEGLKEFGTGGLYHGGWVLQLESFDAVRGYAALSNGEDQDPARRLNEAKVTICDPCDIARPFSYPLELAPQDEGDFLHPIVVGLRIAHQSADKRFQFALVAQQQSQELFVRVHRRLNYSFHPATKAGHGIFDFIRRAGLTRGTSRYTDHARRRFKGWLWQAQNLPPCFSSYAASIGWRKTAASTTATC